MNETQRQYQDAYETLSMVLRGGLDVAGNAMAEALRSDLDTLWGQMTVLEREPFLAPGCLSRERSGPVGRELLPQLSRDQTRRHYQGPRLHSQEK